MANEKLNPVLHVIVIGFHHKKGCQVEYAYPPLIEGQPVDSHELPVVWKNLPSLALPDGAHNCDKDTVYFHLPSREDDKTTVYGISCYRQIDAKEVLNKSSEVTRNSIQKCVCVLSRLPLYGVIEARLEMITYAWFREKDFTQVSLLEETFRQLCASCNNSLLEGSQVFLGLSCKELVVQYKQQIVQLFKLILLERKVLVYGSPVKPVCTTLLTLLSLFPDMVEFGLKESACSCPHRQLSSTLRNARANSVEEEDFLEVHYTDDLDTTKGGQGHFSKKHSLTNLAKEKDTGVVEQLPGGASDSSQTLNLESPASSKGTMDSCGGDSRTPTGGIREKSESEGLEKNTAAVGGFGEEEEKKAIVIISQGGFGSTSSSVDIEKITRPVVIQSQGDATITTTGDQVILEQCSRTTKKIDPLEFMEDITHLECVQASNGGIENLAGGMRVQASNGTIGKVIGGGSHGLVTNGVIGEDLARGNRVEDKSGHRVLPTELSEENLASEGTASEFGTNSNMEDLLESEECLEWGEDKLLLEIESELESHTEATEGDPKPARMRVERGDSTTSWTSQASSVASDLGEASVKVISGLKNRISSIWESPSPPPDDSTEVANVHHQDSKSQQSSACASEKSTPSKSNHSSPDKQQIDRSSAIQSTGHTHDVTDNHIPSTGPPQTTTLSTDQCGFPIRIFTNGVLCHPYLSLQYYDVLQDVNIRGFVIGASNMLFKQKRHLYDVLVEVCDCKMVIHDETLKKQLTLSTADLRFADHLVKCVSEDRGNVFLDETEWEGGDEWLRGQFKLYLASLLVTVHKGDEKMQEDFNPLFVQAYKTSNNYKLWSGCVYRGLKEAPPGHPFQGQLSVSDVRMRLAHTMQSSERGKKLMSAAGTTGKALGGALTSVKSSVSTSVTGLFSSLRKWSSTEAPADS